MRVVRMGRGAGQAQAANYQPRRENRTWGCELEKMGWKRRVVKQGLFRGWYLLDLQIILQFMKFRVELAKGIDIRLEKHMQRREMSRVS